jgi:hypothetical protein
LAIITQILIRDHPTPLIEDNAEVFVILRGTGALCCAFFEAWTSHGEGAGDGAGEEEEGSGKELHGVGLSVVES